MPKCPLARQIAALIKAHPDEADLMAALTSLVSEFPRPISPRDHEAAEYILQGMTNREIAAAMKIAERTAKAHCNSLYQRYGLSRIQGNARVRLAVLLHERTMRGQAW